MNSKIDVRVFAVEKAVAILGAGTPAKDVVSKAMEIEKYVIGNAELPEMYNQEQALGQMLTMGISSIAGIKNVVEEEGKC